MIGYRYSSCLFSVLVLLSCCVHLSRSAGSNDVAGQLRFLLDEETSLRQKLDSRVQALRQRAAQIDTSIIPCDCNPPTVPTNNTQVAYTGTLSSTLSSLTTSKQFNFSGDVMSGLTDVGNAYLPRSGHFSAPVSGIYGLSLATYLPARYWVEMQLVLDGTAIMTVKSGHYTSRYDSMGTNLVLVNMTAGQDVWPTYVTGSGYLYGGGFATFSGFLLREL